MNIFETHLYYPYIHVPERALIHSLLFQDGIQRIIPSFIAGVPVPTNKHQALFSLRWNDVGGDLMSGFWRAMPLTREP